MWCVAELDAPYIARMEDVLALYERPDHPKEPVVCLDEKPVSLHADVRPPRPARPGHIAKRDNEYQRCGTANIFGVIEPLMGRHLTCATANRSGAQFADMIQTVVASDPRVRTIHLVLDNCVFRRSRSLISDQSDHSFRSKAISDLGPKRSRMSLYPDHRMRWGHGIG